MFPREEKGMVEAYKLGAACLLSTIPPFSYSYSPSPPPMNCSLFVYGY